MEPSLPAPRRYSESCVCCILGLQRWLSRLRLSGLLYAIEGLPLYLLWRFAVMGRSRIRVIGRDRLPAKGTGFFLLSNHVSMAEAPTIASLDFPKPFWFPAKAEFYKSWALGFGWFLFTACRTFPVRRGERDAAAIGLMEDFLKKGDSVLLFPEGTRSSDGELQPGKKGVGMIIHNARPLVVPVFVRGFEPIWPADRPLPTGRSEHAVVVYGEPLDLSHHWDRPFGPEAGQVIVDEVMAAISRLKEELEELDAKPA